MVGTDIIEVARIEKLIKEKGDKFLNKIYTQKEIDYCESKGPNKYQHYAGRFAAKEAVFKAVCNASKTSLRFKDIEVKNPTGGNPVVEIYDGKYWNIFYKPGSVQTVRVLISISHIKKYATATAMLVEANNVII